MTTVQIDVPRALACIEDKKNKRVVIWTPSVLVECLGLGRYPSYPPQALKTARHVLQELSEAGVFVQRPQLQSRYTLREIAYERPTRGGDEVSAVCLGCKKPFPPTKYRPSRAEDLQCPRCDRR